MSSGMEITRPSDNPYGTSKALALRGEVAGLQQYQRNVDDGTAWLNASDAALEQDRRRRPARPRPADPGRHRLGRPGSARGRGGRDRPADRDGQAGVERPVRRPLHLRRHRRPTTRPYAAGAVDTFGGNRDTMQREIGPGVLLDVNVDVSGVLRQRPGRQQTTCCCTRCATSPTISAAATATNCAAPTSSGSTPAFDSLNQVRADVGARTNRLMIADGRLSALEENSVGLLSNVAGCRHGQDADRVHDAAVGVQHGAEGRRQRGAELPDGLPAIATEEERLPCHS